MGYTSVIGEKEEEKEKEKDWESTPFCGLLSVSSQPNYSLELRVKDEMVGLMAEVRRRRGRETFGEQHIPRLPRKPVARTVSREFVVVCLRDISAWCTIAIHYSGAILYHIAVAACADGIWESFAKLSKMLSRMVFFEDQRNVAKRMQDSRCNNNYGQQQSPCGVAQALRSFRPSNCLYLKEKEKYRHGNGVKRSGEERRGEERRGEKRKKAKRVVRKEYGEKKKRLVGDSAPIP
uniref:Uncharacterized protein n=1 Tax=Vespula pensylvanica TaxID=30213 RepID=A0A834NX70_VESPE|nr:hypothetical protein H0235_010413 [Vespula pensylvanica]